MRQEEYYTRKHARLREYGERPLDQRRPILITADVAYLQTPAGLAAANVAASLFARMSPNVSLGFDDVSGLDRRGQTMSLHEHLLKVMKFADKFGTFQARPIQPDDYVVHLGPGEGDRVIHGVGWNAYVGHGPSPLAVSDTPTTFGAALAVIMGGTQLFSGPFPSAFAVQRANALHWTNDFTQEEPVPERDLGKVWFAGMGSVGSAALYFMVIEGLLFEATYFDYDHIKIENVDRSPIFGCDDIGLKVDSAKVFLDDHGLSSTPVNGELGSSPLWTERQHGVPDLLISAANEHNVRSAIEAGLPPVQIYATTGSNWQTTLLRHLPNGEPCSCCVFEPDKAISTRCATDTVVDHETGEKHDAALPFLSFAAGLMVAAEASKLNLPKFVERPSRVAFQPLAEELFISFPARHRTGCECASRDRQMHQAMNTGSKYAHI